MFDTDKFIDEMKIRPALYTRKLEKSSPLSEELWDQVGICMTENWHQLNFQGQRLAVADLKKKWKSLKDAFKRELRFREESAKNLGATRNRKEYVHFNQLNFLLEYFPQIKEEDGTLISKKEQMDIVDSQPANNIATDMKPELENHFMLLQDSLISENSKFYDIETDPEKDLDRQFLLSYLPNFKNLSNGDNMLVRKEIAKIMDDAVSGKLQRCLNPSGLIVRRKKAYLASSKVIEIE